MCVGDDVHGNLVDFRQRFSRDVFFPLGEMGNCGNLVVGEIFRFFRNKCMKDLQSLNIEDEG